MSVRSACTDQDIILDAIAASEAWAGDRPGDVEFIVALHAGTDQAHRFVAALQGLTLQSLTAVIDPGSSAGAALAARLNLLIAAGMSSDSIKALTSVRSPSTGPLDGMSVAQIGRRCTDNIAAFVHLSRLASTQRGIAPDAYLAFLAPIMRTSAITDPGLAAA